MEQGGAGGDGGDKNQQQRPQDRKGKEVMQQGREAQAQAQREVEVESAPPPQLPQQPVQCPRCDSLNTKFCYYNNYSLSQPRFFCKTCRRYWTHGGTLRNVPVGGGCRKAKRGRGSQSSSSAENSASSSRSSQQQPRPRSPSHEIQLVVQAAQPNLAPVLGPRDIFPLGFPSNLTHFLQGGAGVGLGSGSGSSSCSGGGGYLSSLGGIHHLSSLNPPPNNPFDQGLNVGDVGIGVGSNNLQGVLSGLINNNNNNNNVANSVGPHQRQIRPSSHQQYFQLGVGERDFAGPLFPPISEQQQQQQGLVIPSSTMANSSTAAAAAIHRDWTHHHRFITEAAANNNNIAAAVRATDGSMWSTVSTTTVSGNGNNSQSRQRNVAASAAAANVMPNHQWPNVPGFGPPPPPPPSSF